MDWKQIEQDGQWPKGIVELYGEINQDSYEKMDSAFSFLESIGSPDVMLKINSRGGMNHYGENICSLIEMYAGKITGVAMQDCSSIAFLILQKCDHREAFSNAVIVPHLTENTRFPERFTSGMHKKLLKSDKKVVKFLKNKIKRLKKVDKVFYKYLSEKSNLSKKECRELLKKDERLSSKKALKLGFIDKIIRSL